MCFGLKEAHDVFQRQIDATFGDIKGIADDLIIYGFDDGKKDHDATLHAVLNRARQTGVKFNKERMMISARFFLATSSAQKDCSPIPLKSVP